MKRCPTCSKDKSPEDYGASFYCKACMAGRARDRRAANPATAEDKQKAQAWREANKDRRAAWNRAWLQANRENRALYRRVKYAANRDQELEGARTWKKQNASRVSALNAKRNAAKLQAIPRWADLDRIEAIYEQARNLSAETGIPHHVDHIYPLQSRVMCGLHCEANLQILTGAANLSKGNRHWPGMAIETRNY